MKKLLLFIFLIWFPAIVMAQRPSSMEPQGQDQLGMVTPDTTQKPPITAYKIISGRGDTTYVDTTLTIQKDYKFNYLRRDNFELVQFSNIGQTYNSLAYTIKGEDLIPEFGARARHFNFMEMEDISYYEVPTPLTEVYFRTVPEQGQTLDAFFTINTSPRLNFSLAYKGLRSLGKYQHQLTSTGNFRAILSYNTLNERYRVKTHFVSQDLLNQENGGLSELALQQYTSKELEFEDRSLLEVKFENAENVLFGKRFYLDQQYDLVKREDDRITLHHILDFSDKKYIFRQASAASGIFGEAFRTTNLRDQVKSRHIKNIAAVSYENSTLGRLTAKVGMSYYNYGYNSILILDENEVIINRMVGENYSAGAAYTNTFGRFSIYGDGMLNLVGDFTGHYLTAGAGYTLNENNSLSVEVNSNERAPNFNFLLNQSDYFEYNWQTNFENQSIRSLELKLDSKRLVQLDASISQIDQYAYFSQNEEGAVKPFQFDATVNYMKLKAGREFSYGKFALDNTLMYQSVTSGAEVFNVPSFVTRNSLYFSDHLFRRALFLQTGFTLKYFTPYEMNGYDPVLAEFYVQNEQELGGFPVVDFFLNARIRQTRIFFKLEHVNSLIDGNNNFVAPEYPHRDFLIRFGFVWNFFL